MTPAIAGLLAGGLLLLALGGELLVRGATRLATLLGISPLVAGLTIVAFGTSAPELAVSVMAAWAGSADVAVGNVIGSNIFNSALITGACALLVPLAIAPLLLRRDMGAMLLATLLVAALAADGTLTRSEGALLVLLLGAYTWLVVRTERAAAVATSGTVAPGSRARAALAGSALTLAGLGFLVLGADWFVDGAAAFARALGVSELVIGLTIVAGGTSLPEVAASLAATYKGERGIAVGNVVGSNIYNLLGILGTAALCAPAPLAVSPVVRATDLPVLLAVSALLMLVAFSRHRIGRSEGALLLAVFAGYMLFLVAREGVPHLFFHLAVAAGLLAPVAIWIVIRGFRPAPVDGDGGRC